MRDTNNIAKFVKNVRPKAKPTKKTMLIDLTSKPESYRWLERQAAKFKCSKTAYVEALIEQDKERNSGS